MAFFLHGLNEYVSSCCLSEHCNFHKIKIWIAFFPHELNHYVSSTQLFPFWIWHAKISNLLICTGVGHYLGPYTHDLDRVQCGFLTIFQLTFCSMPCTFADFATLESATETEGRPSSFWGQVSSSIWGNPHRLNFGLFSSGFGIFLNIFQWILVRLISPITGICCFIAFKAFRSNART